MVHKHSNHPIFPSIAEYMTSRHFLHSLSTTVTIDSTGPSLTAKSPFLTWVHGIRKIRVVFSSISCIDALNFSVP